MDEESIGMSMKTQAVPETGKMLLQQNESRIPRHDCQGGTCQDGPGQTCCHPGMETP